MDLGPAGVKSDDFGGIGVIFDFLCHKGHVVFRKIGNIQ